MKTSLLLLSTVMFAGVSNAQLTYTEVLDHNNVSATINDEGQFFNDSNNQVAAYEVPKGSGKTTIYMTSPWVAALDINGQLHLSADSYSFDGFHSGPIADPIHYGTNAYNNLYQNSLWTVTSAEIQNHIANYSSPGYIAPASITDWPGNGDASIGVADQLAPYADLDNDGVYEPNDGEYPEIRGDEATLVILNDESFQPTGMQLGMELHIMFYHIFDGTYRDNITFMNVRAFNRSPESYYDYKQTFYIDYDIGNYSDDYIGCDPGANVGYGYNGDAFDEDGGGNLGYQANPPCQGLTVLSHDMEAFGYFMNGGSYPYTDPNNPTEMWNHMNAMFANGEPWVYGGQGYASSAGATSTPTSFMFSGDYYESQMGFPWYESDNGSGSGNPTGDRRVTVTIGEDEFLSGSSICSDYAWVFDNSDSAWQNVQNVINISNSLQTWYDAADGSFLCNGSQFVSLEEEEVVDFLLYPNPSNGHVTLSLPQIESELNVQITDVTGRVIHDMNYFNTSEIQLNLSGATGLYLVKTSVGNNSSIKRLICN